MGEQWMTPPVVEVRDTDIRDRAATLVDLLLLTDALPIAERCEVEMPTFRDLCSRG